MAPARISRPSALRMASGGAAALACLFALAGCGKSQESKVLAAIKARFPDGQQRCLGMSGDAVGMHILKPSDGTLFFPSTGWTSPLRHLFVFWAGPANDAPPELATLLAQHDVLKRVVVEGTLDVRTSGMGTQVLSKAGYFTHVGWVHHERTPYPVALYLTRRYDQRFGYEAHSIQRDNYALASLQSRAADSPLPPEDQDDPMQMATPYALSIVSSTCAVETPARVASAEDIRLWDGTPAVQAEVDYAEAAPPWAKLPAFTRIAPGTESAPFTQERRATIMFAVEGDHLRYVEEKRP